MSDRLRPALFQLLRWRYALLWAWVVFAAGRKPFLGIDWDWFKVGTDLLFRGSHPSADGPGGLHVYATEPFLHMGPPSLVAAEAVRGIYPGDGRIGAVLLMCALGPVVVLVAERAAVRARGLRDALDEPLLAVVTLVSGAAFLYFWVEATWAWGRIDEFMAIGGAAAALWFIVHRNPILAGVAVGLSIGAKSWAVFLLPVLAGLPWRHALRAGAVALAVAAAMWLPFLLADSGTIDALQATEGVRVRPASGAHVLGIELGAIPDWLRPVQAAVALALAVLAVVRGRWAAALLLAVAARLALDPSVLTYYAAALLFAALVWDLLGSRLPLPIWGVATFAVFYGVARVFEDPQAQGLAQIAIVIAASVVVLGAPKAWLRRAQPSATPT